MHAPVAKVAGPQELHGVQTRLLLKVHGLDSRHPALQMSHAVHAVGMYGKPQAVLNVPAGQPEAGAHTGKKKPMGAKQKIKKLGIKTSHGLTCWDAVEAAAVDLLDVGVVARKGATHEAAGEGALADRIAGPC